MNGLLKQSQTASNIPFYLVLASDGKTPATGLVPVVTLSKNGGNFAAASGAVTEIASGWYSVAGNATDTNTLGPLIVKASVATADDVHDLWQVVSFDTRDSVRGTAGTALPNAAAAAANGLLINGSNTGTVTLGELTITGVTTHTGATIHTGNVSMAAGLTITQSAANTPGVIITGNGTSAGLRLIGGATGNGLDCFGGGTSGNGCYMYGSAIGNGLFIQGTGAHGMVVKAGTSNNAVSLQSSIGLSGTLTGTFSLGAFTVSGATTLTGSVDLSSTLTVTGATTFTGAVTASNASNNIVGIDVAKISGDATAADALETMLDGSGGNTLSLGALTVSNVLTVSGATTLTGAVTASNASNNIVGIDVKKWLGTTVSTPTVAGVPNVNVKTWNDIATVALPLIPTTAGRTLDVSAGGEAGIDWANVGTPSSTVSLTNTTVNLVTTTTNVTNMPNIGNGAYSVTATVTDGTDPLQNALVRVTSGIDTFSNLSDASGHATFSLNAGTFTVSITHAGYTFTPTTRTVTGNQTGTLVSSPLAMTATVVPATPTDPIYCRVYGYMRDQRTGEVLEGIRVNAARLPESGQAYSGGFLIGSECSALTDETGLVELDLIRNDQITPTGTQWRIICAPAGIDTTQTLTGSLFDLSTLPAL